MFGLTQRGTLRWKEWVPLVTQQQRLRSLIQVIAYNVRYELPDDMISSVTLSYYYTLHLNSLSSPFYTSEKLESENPKWTEVEISREIGAAPGVVLRLWVHPSEGEDQTISVWGVYFSGLVYIGPRLVCTDPSELEANTVIFHMHGGYFTSAQCFLNVQPATPRTISVQLPASQVKPSYSVNLFLRLQSMQQAIARQGAAAAAIREEMTSSSGVKRPNRIAGKTLRRLLADTEPPPRDKVLALNKQIEALKFKVHLLYQQRDIANSNLEALRTKVLNNTVNNQNSECELMGRYHRLSKDVERLSKQKQEMEEIKTKLQHVSSLLDARKKDLISQLYHIYPIKHESDGSYTILGVKLPDAESLEGVDDIRVSVALGFVAHLVHMMSIFLNVPTRYPIYHFGSRSKIIDHITDKIPDKDREFPLYRGKDKLLFEYGVYLLNKNIAQLRWVCGITTTDLKATLPNLLPLLTLAPQEQRLKVRRERPVRPGNGESISSHESDPLISRSCTEVSNLLIPSSPASDTSIYRKKCSFRSEPAITSPASDPQMSRSSDVTKMLPSSLALASSPGSDPQVYLKSWEPSSHQSPAS